MEERPLLILGIAFCLSTIIYLASSQKQRDLLLIRLRLRGRRASTAATPPRSFSPGKVFPGNNAAPQAAEYLNSFPPSRREALAEVVASLPDDVRPRIDALGFNGTTFSQHLIGWQDDFRKCDPNRYTATAFTAGECITLGNFPDYATLSGVPLPRPYEGFDVDKAVPRPYRPFRWAYHQTMSLTKLEPEWWLEVESTYRERIFERKGLYEKHGEGVLQWLPGSELACKELMEIALQFLCARYPHYFSLHSDNKTFENKILGTEQDVTEKHPLLVMLDNIPEDFAITLRNPETGYYHFRAGMICSALGWNVASKIGLRLHEIHAPIPDYKEKMQFSMDRFFAKMPSDKPIQRGSWGLEVDKPLYMPPGDPHEKYRDLQAPELTLNRCHLRVDWQTLRRLPLSGAIVFNFKALFTPVEEFRNEPYIPSLVLKVLNEGKEHLMKYKSTWHVEHVVKPALAQYEQEQIEKRMIEKDWEVETLKEAPYFPGWQEKWQRKQGF